MAAERINRHNMTRCAEDRATYQATIERDGGRCLECSAQGDHVHEIVGRAHFGKKKRAELFWLGNRCVLCWRCHNPMVHMKAGRTRLLGRLSKLYHYDYDSNPIFRAYLY